MSITAHGITQEPKGLVLQAELVALHYVYGWHTGKHLAEVFIDVLERLQVLHKVSWYLPILCIFCAKPQSRSA